MVVAASMMVSWLWVVGICVTQVCMPDMVLLRSVYAM